MWTSTNTCTCSVCSLDVFVWNQQKMITSSRAWSITIASYLVFLLQWLPVLKSVEPIKFRRSHSSPQKLPASIKGQVSPPFRISLWPSGPNPLFLPSGSLLPGHTSHSSSPDTSPTFPPEACALTIPPSRTIFPWRHLWFSTETFPDHPVKISIPSFLFPFPALIFSIAHKSYFICLLVCFT